MLPTRHVLRAAAAGFVVGLFACRPSVAGPDATVDGATASTPTPSQPALPTAVAAAGEPEATAGPADTEASGPGAPRRIVAFGDLHGDLASAREAFALAGATDADGGWIGGDLVLVQLGDQTDRGDDELEILDWLEELKRQARADGGAVHVLVGNHELMNVQSDLRYVTPGGLTDFADTPCGGEGSACARAPRAARGRVAAFEPGGPWARRLADHPVALLLDGTVFVHGGILPLYARDGIDALNASVAAWLRDEAPEPAWVRGEQSPVWNRTFSRDTDETGCALLAESLALLGAERMVVGHTVQEQGISSACDGRVWRVDVGLSDYYGGPTQALEIVGDDVRVLR